jgi:hypothetical protein
MFMTRARVRKAHFTKKKSKSLRVSANYGRRAKVRLGSHNCRRDAILQNVSLLLAGGILLLWVCWKMWRELRASSAAPIEAKEAAEASAGTNPEGKPRKATLQRAIRASAAGPCDGNLTVNGIWRRAQAAGMLTRHPASQSRNDKHRSIAAVAR